MKRPKRLSYPNGIYGDLDYERALEKYCSHLEKKLAIHPDLEREKEAFAVDFAEWIQRSFETAGTDSDWWKNNQQYSAKQLIELYKNRDNGK